MVKFVYTTALVALIATVNAVPDPSPEGENNDWRTPALQNGWHHHDPSNSHGLPAHGFPSQYQPASNQFLNFASQPQMQIIPQVQPQMMSVPQMMPAPQMMSAPQPVMMAPQPQVQMMAAPRPAPVMMAPQPQVVQMAAPQPQVMPIIQPQPQVHHPVVINPFHNPMPENSNPASEGSNNHHPYSRPEDEPTPFVNPMFSPIGNHHSQPEDEPTPFVNPMFSPIGNHHSQPESNHHVPSVPYHPTFSSDDEHDGPNSINLHSPGIVEGADVIHSIEYRADGNYKMEVIFKSAIPMNIVDLRVGKCNEFTPGVALIDKDSEEVTMEIDMSICQQECDFQDDQLLSSIDILNQPIDIIFGLTDPQDEDHVISRYHVRPNAMYHEDYILELNTGTEDTRQLVIDDAGKFFQVEDNVQFSFMTYMGDDFATKTPSTKSSAPAGYTTYLEIAPTNGFTPEKMINVPEICFLKDLTNAKTLLLWDMGANPTCVDKLVYNSKLGTWRYPLNYYFVMGYNAHTMNHNSFKLTCNVRLCGNTAENPCAEKLANCEYA